MEEIEKDLCETKKVIYSEEGGGFSDYSKIYAGSNENLENLFKRFSVKDKKVFSVMASADQPFCAYYNGAKSVDTFDVNKLAKHYYYLRKWLLKYEDKFYPDPFAKDNEWIYNLLSLVKCNSADEELSFRYWFTYVNETPGFLGKYLFNRFNKDNRTGITDNQKLLDIIDDKELVFKHQNIGGKIDKSKKYDTIILSNILEYNNYYRELLMAYRDNLYDILEDDGEVVCSNLLDLKPSTFQQMVFLEKFDYEEFNGGNLLRRDRAVGYCYRKK